MKALGRATPHPESRRATSIVATLLMHLSLVTAVLADGGSRVLAEFDMPECQDVILIPVTCSDQTYSFMLDTGAGLCRLSRSQEFE